jgi:endo-1,4-beta-mannosidase
MRHSQLPEDQHLKKFLLGVNYWPGKVGVQMWSRWDPEQIREDLIRMTELGMNAHRSFLFMPDFLPTPHETNPVMLERFQQYLTLCEEIGIGTFPSFFVGHMSSPASLLDTCLVKIGMYPGVRGEISTLTPSS